MQGRCKHISRKLLNEVQGTNLVILKTILKDVLHNQTASFAESNFVPHAAESLIDVLHDLWGSALPAEFKQLLPDMTGVAVDDSLGNATKQLVDHDSLVLLTNTVKSLLDDMAAERIHAQIECVAADSTSNGLDLLRSTVLEAALDEEIAEAVDHEGISLVNDGLDDLVLLVLSTDLELLLQEDRGLLVIAVNNLVDNILPVTTHVAVEQATVIHGFGVVEVVGRRFRERLIVSVFGNEERKAKVKEHTCWVTPHAELPRPPG